MTIRQQTQKPFQLLKRFHHSWKKACEHGARLLVGSFYLLTFVGCENSFNQSGLLEASTSSSSTSSTPTAGSATITFSASSYALAVSAAATIAAPTLTGYSGSVTYSASPALPTGLSLNSSTGAITGTPTVAQSSTNYTITATAQSVAVGSVAIAIYIGTAPTVTITTNGGAGYSVNAASPTLGGTCTVGSTLSTSNGTVLADNCPTTGAWTVSTSLTDQSTATVTVTATMNDLTGTDSITLTYCSALNALPASAAYSSAGACGGANCDGTSSKPYPITSIATLVKLYEETTTNAENGLYYQLQTDLDLACYDWIPIGTSGQPFSGFFDGNSKTISNLNVSRSTTDHVGFFGYISGDTGTNAYRLQRLTLSNATVIGEDWVGGFIGRMDAGLIRNLTYSGKITGTGEAGYAGGIIGTYNSGIQTAVLPGMKSMVSLSSSGNLTQTGFASGYVGGIAGNVSAGGAGFPSNMLTVSSSMDIVGKPYSGGIVGQISGLAGETFLSIATYTGTISGQGYVGGVAGRTTGSGIITSSYSTGSVSSTGDYAGGFAGYLNGVTLSASYATGAVSANAVNYVGGFVGNAEGGTYSTAYATGAVTGNWRVGGFSGNSGDSAFANYANCYATGAVSAANLVGGFVGVSSGSGSTIDTSYASGAVTSAGGTKGDFIGSCFNYTLTGAFALNTLASFAGSAGNCTYTSTGINTAAALKAQATFVGFDFTTIWSIVEGISYPTLR